VKEGFDELMRLAEFRNTRAASRRDHEWKVNHHENDAPARTLPEGQAPPIQSPLRTDDHPPPRRRARPYALVSRAEARPIPVTSLAHRRPTHRERVLLFQRESQSHRQEKVLDS
jgi:hypothetical protein